MSVKGKVLVIDDSEGIRKLLKEICLVLGFTAITARSGDEAVKMVTAELAAGSEIGVALVDMRMPGLDTVAICESLHNVCSEMKIFLMTGYSGCVAKAEAQACGACDVLNKPFTIEQIKEILEKNLN